MADASSTTSFTLCRLAPFCAQLLREADSRLDNPPCPLLDALNPASQCRHPEFVILVTQLHRGSHADPKRLAHRRGNHQAAFLSDLNSSLQFHVPPSSPVSLSYRSDTFEIKWDWEA